ncbi:acyl-coenzyme A synthetase ACSM1, mitochondrial isoform X4 [Suricata suricatta]|uniref:acyl-coenzyme A synthetase ACSM1, mitochondrial isoform X4 n=1 Tax=Suricata suricatta TaxID=37032 RepID=UPI00115582C0|nr:acyl-coenzyme A synthetase ACSM1, mitochondrial isoform X4 [Suricata suricatta]
MQRLMRLHVFWGIRQSQSYHGFHPAPWYLYCRSLSGAGGLRWNDHNRPAEFNFASNVLDYWTQMEQEGKRGPNPALWWVDNQGDEVKWSFGEITDLSRCVANVLTQTCGLQQGDRLALILPRVPEWWLVAIGCIRAGIVFMPGTTQMKAKDILYRLQVSKAKGIVTTDTLAPEVDSVVSECPALKTKLLVSHHSRQGWLDFRSLIKSASTDHTCVKSKTLDPMAIFFTSGTTGLPKMVKHCHGLAWRSSLPSCRKLLQLNPSDVLWCFSDPGWILAVLGALFEPWTAGSTLFVHHLPQFDAKVIQQTLCKYPITQCLAAPAVYRMILQQISTSLRFPALEHCATGGEALLPEEQEEWRRRTGLLLYQVYGQSETGIACGTLRGMKIKPGSMGKSISPLDIQTSCSRSLTTRATSCQSTLKATLASGSSPPSPWASSCAMRTTQERLPKWSVGTSTTLGIEPLWMRTATSGSSGGVTTSSLPLGTELGRQRWRTPWQNIQQWLSQLW